VPQWVRVPLERVLREPERARVRLEPEESVRSARVRLEPEELEPVPGWVRVPLRSEPERRGQEMTRRECPPGR